MQSRPPSFSPDMRPDIGTWIFRSKSRCYCPTAQKRKWVVGARKRAGGEIKGGS
jgi:hypothetical protein